MTSTPSHPDEITALVEQIVDLGGRAVSSQSDGAHELHEMSVGGLDVQLRRDYDRWFVNLSSDGLERAPASFWVVAAHGSHSVPDEPAAIRWVAELADVLPDVLEHLATVGALVAEIAAAYRSMLESRFGPRP